MVACGGSTAAAPGSGGQTNAMPGDGTAAGTQAMPGAPQTPPPGGGAGGSSGVPPEGICSKLCVSTVSFVIDNPLSADRFFKGGLRACRNGDQECHTGSIPAPGTGNTVSFGRGVPSDGPSAWSPDEWKTIQLRWDDINAMALHDGDVFSLTFENGNERVLLLEQVVTFQIVRDCAGSCLYARYELQGATFPQGGESNLGGAGGDSDDAGTGSSGEGGVPSH